VSADAPADRPLAIGAILVDVDRLMPRGARWFNDPCHLTSEGSAVFAGFLVEAMLPLVERGR